MALKKIKFIIYTEFIITLQSVDIKTPRVDFSYAKLKCSFLSRKFMFDKSLKNSVKFLCIKNQVDQSINLHPINLTDSFSYQ